MWSCISGGVKVYVVMASAVCAFAQVILRQPCVLMSCLSMSALLAVTGIQLGRAQGCICL